MTLSEMAKETGTSETDIINFMNNVLSSMNQLKLNFAIDEARKTGNEELLAQLMKICIKHANDKLQKWSDKVLNCPEENRKVSEMVYSMLVY